MDSNQYNLLLYFSKYAICDKSDLYVYLLQIVKLNITIRILYLIESFYNLS